MRTAFGLLVLLLGCSHNSHTKIPNTLHITEADACEGLEGTFGGKLYKLIPERGTAQLGVACYHPISTADVGRDFAARVDDGVIIVEIPGFSHVRYAIDSVTEDRR